jgi:putative membrane protein
MPPKITRFLLKWIINTLAVLVAVYIVHGIHYQRSVDLLIASLLLGILNTFLRPILLFLALPLLIFSLGLFILVINAALLYFVGYLLAPHFYVESFSAAFWGAAIIGIVSILLNSMTGTGDARVKVRRDPPPTRREPPGTGPVIDV